MRREIQARQVRGVNRGSVAQEPARRPEREFADYDAAPRKIHVDPNHHEIPAQNIGDSDHRIPLRWFLVRVAGRIQFIASLRGIDRTVAVDPLAPGGPAAIVDVHGVGGMTSHAGRA